MESLTVAPDTVVTVSYVLFDEAGEVVDRATQEEPLRYVHGYAQIVPGLERGLAGMRAGEQRTITVAPDEAFGELSDEAVFEIERADVPDSAALEPGDELLAEDADGDSIAMRVVDVRPETIVVDTNHPLAGQTLRFEVQVDEVRTATDDEIEEAQSELEDALDGACGCGHDHGEGHDHDHAHGGGDRLPLVQLSKKTKPS
jgi:FKBP-type peptidyl-prolyl cis-trans isomerase SlyD